jgi:hypothetical protein
LKIPWLKRLEALARESSQGYFQQAPSGRMTDGNEMDADHQTSMMIWMPKLLY